MSDSVKIAAIYADLKAFEKKFLVGGLSADDKAKFINAMAEFATWLAPNIAIEVPRLVKKPGGETKRVETQAQLDAALADGWLLRLPAPNAAPPDDYADALKMDLATKDAETEPETDADESDDTEPEKRKPGRPRK